MSYNGVGFFSIQNITSIQFGVDEIRLDGGDFLRVISSSVPLNLRFYEASTGRLLGESLNTLAGISFDFRSQSSDNSKLSEGDTPRKFGQVGISAASNVTPMILITEGVKTDSTLIAGIIQSVGAGSVSNPPVEAIAAAAFYTVVANPLRRDLILKNADYNSANTMWLGGANGSGIGLVKGEGYTFENYTGAVQVYSDNGGDLMIQEVLN